MKTMKQKIIYLSILIIVILAGGISFYLISQQNKTQSIPNNNELVTYEGTIVCAPHKDTHGEHTLECASSLKTDSNIYYLLNTESVDNGLSRVTGSSQKVRVKGTLQQAPDTKYQTNGTITVTSFELL